MTLFRLEDVVLHSGRRSDWRIDCDALTTEDWDCLAYMAMERLGWPKIYGVLGVPRGGLPLAHALDRYITGNEGPLLLVDDVLTTGGSMRAMLDRHPDSRGLVVFARGLCPAWVTPIFQMQPPPPPAIAKSQVRE